MSTPLTPPPSKLPAGAARWATVNDVAIHTKKDLRTVHEWCAKKLVVTRSLVGGYGGLWIAVDEDWWPIDNAEGIAAYRAQRQASSRIGAAAAVASRSARAAEAKRPARSSRKTA